MEWHYEDCDAIRLCVAERRFNEETARTGIPDFYREYREKYELSPRIGVCRMPDESYDWVYSLGDFYNGSCPDGMTEIEIPAGGYCIFCGKSVNEINSFIYGEWFITGGYEIIPGDTIEVYDESGCVCEIRVPVKKR